MRRRLVLGFIASSFASHTIFAGSVSKIAILRELVDAIGAAGDAIASLTDGVAHLVVTGSDAYDYVSAKRERNRLIDISSRTVDLIAQKNVRVVTAIDDYLSIPNPAPEQWQIVTFALNRTLSDVVLLLEDVRAERGDFVLQPTYLALSNSLNSRVAALQQLSALSPPNSPEERELLKQANNKYKILITNATNAVTELNKYISNTPNN